MQNHYSILGINPNASEKDIKKSFRRLAMKHHPDKGGDAEQFKTINEAYEVLSNKTKRNAYDISRTHPREQRGNPQGDSFSAESPFGVHTSNVPFEDISAHFGDLGGIFFGEGFSPRRTRANRNIDVKYDVSLEEAYTGINKEIEVTLPSGLRRSLSLKIPAGVKAGDRLNFKELGDNTISNIPAGDLRVTVNVTPHTVFERDRNNIDLRMNIGINSIDAMLGTTIFVKGIDKKTYNIKIPQGSGNEQVVRLSGKGMPLMNHLNTYGDLYIIVNLVTPRDLSKEQISLLKQVRNCK